MMKMAIMIYNMALHDPDPMTLSCRRACAVDLNCHLAPCSTAQPISLAFDHVFFTASPARPRGHHSRPRSCGSFGALDGCICSGMGESCAAGALGDMSTPRVLAAAEPARSKTIAARVTAISQRFARAAAAGSNCSSTVDHSPGLH
jgi:hypothetical protein